MKRIRIVARADGETHIQAWQPLTEGREEDEVAEAKEFLARADLKTLHFENASGDYVVLRAPFTVVLQIREVS